MDEVDPYSLDENGQLQRPEMLLTDWIEIGLIIILLCLSLPLNGIALIRLLRIWRDARNGIRTKVYNKKI